jgi:predicted nucleic acid-binding protein
LDSGVLIAAARSKGRDGELAIHLLEDPARVFSTSPFLYLEVTPKAVFNRRKLEKALYERYFRTAEWFRDLVKIEAVTRREAEKLGLGAMDALHLAAAHLAKADEFVTTEKPTRPIYRSELVRVVYLFA